VVIGSGSLVVFLQGPRGRILLYKKATGRTSVGGFLDVIPIHLWSRFDRAFRRFCADGMAAASNNSFKPLTGSGNGIWAWKQHDHRLLSFRGPDADGRVQQVLLCGWVKDIDAGPSGSVEERKQVEKAVVLQNECKAVVSWEAVEERAAVVASGEAVGEASMSQQVEVPFGSMDVPVEAASSSSAFAPVEAPLQSEEHAREGDRLYSRGLSRLLGVPITTFRQWRLDGKISSGHLDGGHIWWSWEEADAVAAQVAALRAEPMRAARSRRPVSGEKEQEAMPKRRSGAKGKVRRERKPERGMVGVRKLSRLIKVGRGTLHQWIKRGQIPSGELRGSLRVWTRAEAYDIVRRVDGFRQRLATYRKGWRRGEDGEYACPACGHKVVAPSAVFGHLLVCPRVWDGNGLPPPQPVSVPQAAVPVAAVPVLTHDEREVIVPRSPTTTTTTTRASLLQLAEGVVDGKVAPEDFVQEARVYWEAVARCEAELKRLRGEE